MQRRICVVRAHLSAKFYIRSSPGEEREDLAMNRSLLRVPLATTLSRTTKAVAFSAVSCIGEELQLGSQVNEAKYN